MHISKKFLAIAATVSIATSVTQVQALDFSAMLNNRHNKTTVASAILELWATKAGNNQMAHFLSIIVSEALYEYAEHAFNQKTLRLPNSNLANHLSEQCVIFLLAKTIDLLYGQNTTNGLFDLTTPARMSLAFKGYNIKEVQDLEKLFRTYIGKLLR